MGYEVKLYAVERINEGMGGYASVVAEIDLCKIGDGNLYALMLKRRPDETLAYIYGTDGNTKIVKDRYDELLPVMGVDEVIKAIQADNKKENYRRFAIALAFLKEFKKHFGEDARILAYGH